LADITVPASSAYAGAWFIHNGAVGEVVSIAKLFWHVKPLI
jgi:hypothetical protein